MFFLLEPLTFLEALILTLKEEKKRKKKSKDIDDVFQQVLRKFFDF